MTQKLYEVVDKSYGAKFKLKVGELEKELTLGRLSVLEFVEIEQEFGISIDKFAEIILEKIATNSTLIAWKLLVDKSEFDNDINIFRKCLSPESLQDLSQVIFKMYENSTVSEKNDQRPVD